MLKPSKRAEHVKAGSILGYWAVWELGMVGTVVGKRLGLSQSAEGRAVKRMEQLISENELELGISMAELSRRLNMSSMAVSYGVQRGEGFKGI